MCYETKRQKGFLESHKFETEHDSIVDNFEVKEIVYVSFFDIKSGTNNKMC